MKNVGETVAFERGGAVLTGKIVRVRRATYFVLEDNPFGGKVFVVPARESVPVPGRAA